MLYGTKNSNIAVTLYYCYLREDGLVTAESLLLGTDRVAVFVYRRVAVSAGQRRLAVRTGRFSSPSLRLRTVRTGGAAAVSTLGSGGTSRATATRTSTTSASSTSLGHSGGQQAGEQDQRSLHVQRLSETETRQLLSAFKSQPASQP